MILLLNKTKKRMPDPFKDGDSFSDVEIIANTWREQTSTVLACV